MYLIFHAWNQMAFQLWDSVGGEEILEQLYE